MSDPPDKAIVKHPLSFTEISDNCATYSAKSVANSTELSKIRNSPFFLASQEVAIPFYFPPYNCVTVQLLYSYINRTGEKVRKIRTVERRNSHSSAKPKLFTNGHGWA